MKILSIIALVPAAFLVGCASNKAEITPKASTVMIPEIPALNEANVRLPDYDKAYAIERYVDPVNPDIMHERHVIYRREQRSDWRLEANAGRQILVGNTMSDSEQDLKPALLQQEFAEELQRQRNYGALYRQNATFMLEKGAAMNEATQALMRQAEELKKLSDQKEAENRRLKADIESERSRRRQQDANSAIDPVTGMPRAGS